MDSIPDISKILGIIMENPEIIEKIKNLSQKDDGADISPESEPEEEISVQTQPEQSAKAIETTSVTTSKNTVGNKKRRHDLLCAIKPYVSDSRGKAIDTMLSVIDVLDIIKAR